MDDNYQFHIERLLSRSELDKLNGLLDDDLRKIYGEAHDRWLKRAKLQIERGEKLAYGVWCIDKYSAVNRQLVGVCIFHNMLTTIRQEETLEIKLLYIKKEFRNPINGGKHKGLLLGKKLLEKVISFGQKHDYKIIVADAKADIEATTLFFLKSGFYVSNFHNQFGWPSYQFVKRIPPYYNWDYYDPNMVIEWVCKQWGFSCEKINDNHYKATYSPQVIKLIGLDDPDRFEGPELEVNIAIATDSNDDILRSIGTPQIIFLKTTQSTVPTSPSSKSSLINLEQLKRLTKNPLVNFDLPNGVALGVTIRRQFFEKFKTNERQIFFDGGAYGLLLNKVSEPYILFFDSESVVSSQTLIGCAHIQKVIVDHPYKLWEQYKQLSAFGPEEQFYQYANIKTKMTGIIFNDLEKESVEKTGIDLSKEGWLYIPNREAYTLIRKAQKSRE